MNKKLSVISALLLSAAVAATGCGSSSQSQNSSNGADAPKKQELSVVLSAEPSTIDPSLASTEEAFTMINMYGEGLYRVNPSNKPEPAMAADFPQISPDGKTYTIKLRDGVTWSDGSAVTAQDFVYSWLRTLDPKTKSEYAFLMDNWIKGADDYNKGKTSDPNTVGVKALDDKTIQIQLINPTAFFTRELASQTFFPEKKDFVEKQSGKFGADASNVLANGPFKLEAWNHDQSLVFVKNDKYWDAKNVKLNKITFQAVTDPSTAMNLYQSKDVDLAEITGDQVPQWQGKPDFVQIPKLFSYYLLFNEQKVPAFKNADIRKALTLSIDRQAFVDTVLNNGSKPATGLVPLGTDGGKDNQEFRKTAGDTEAAFHADQAKQLLAKGLKELGLAQMPKIKLTADDDAASKKSVEFIQAAFKQNLGIDTEIETIPKKLRMQRQSNKDYELIAPSRWGADYNDPLTFLDMWTTGNSFNDAGYSNPAYDKLIQQAHVEIDANKRAQEMADAEKILMDDMPVGPIYYLSRAYLKNPNVQDVVMLRIQYEFKWASVK